MLTENRVLKPIMKTKSFSSGAIEDGGKIGASCRERFLRRLKCLTLTLTVLEPWHLVWRKDYCKVVMKRVSYFYIPSPLSCVNLEETVEKREERSRTEMGKHFPYLSWWRGYGPTHPSAS